MAWMAFAMLGRSFAIIALSGTIQMTTELFPTAVRVRGVAIASAVGMATSFTSPFIIHSVRDDTYMMSAIRREGGTLKCRCSKQVSKGCCINSWTRGSV